MRRHPQTTGDYLARWGGVGISFLFAVIITVLFLAHSQFPLIGWVLYAALLLGWLGFVAWRSVNG